MVREIILPYALGVQRVKGLHTPDISTLCLVYMFYVRPILEYNSPEWNPWQLQDIRSVERVQRFFTRAIFKRVKLPTMSYADCLLQIGFH